MKPRPPRYDFPDRMRGVSSAERELNRLERSMSVAYDRRDKFALDYLTRRHQRATRALAVLRAQQTFTEQESPARDAAPAAAGADERTTP
ncbi:hypothetical protein GCE86_19655 [Micromonospora terminaliae]|uniref:Uncharacterized protein n=1 Tax=Micromonospora terminaliae TaxID=1914461 RepID=A0AAJ3DJI2_9ACTN|nr:hypothetical protein [Micromonospora terminaliae]NES28952.1 hypothetical protein [Micromonospora terminaliae]QGL49029.1 hypothetical protein GCE86_19655 [Micromonospora terminaliae]